MKGFKDTIRLEKVVFDYGTASERRSESFIDGMDLSIRKGSITSILGPNGCGKSTVLKLMAGVLRPSGGTIAVLQPEGDPPYSEGDSPQSGNFTDIRSLSSRKRASIMAFLPQVTPATALSVERLVANGRYPHRRLFGGLSDEDKERIEQAISAMGLQPMRSQEIRTLSGGERQRAYLAMILAQDTDIMLLDEPTTYLDIGAAHDIMQTVRDLNSNGERTILMVIHDLDMALRYSDDIVVMDNGSVIGNGSTDDVLSGGSIQDIFGMDIVSVTEDERRGYCLFPRS